MSEARDQLIEFLEAHENDIACGIEDYALLRETFRLFMQREARVQR